MNLYLLRLQVEFGPGADVSEGFVIAAPSAPVARRIAAENAMHEGRRTWFMPKDSSCEKIGEAKTGQKAEVILSRDNAQ